MRGTNRGEDRLLDVRAVGLEAMCGLDPAVDDVEQRSLVDLALAQRQPERPLEQPRAPLGSTRRRAPWQRCRARAAGRPRGRGRGWRGHVRRASSSPSLRGAPRGPPAGRLRARQSAKIASESTVISASARVEAVAGEDLFVVDDDPVVDPDHGAVPDRMVVRLDRRMALRVVADVHEHLASPPRAHAAPRGATVAPERRLWTVHRLIGAAKGVADRVGAPLGDSGEQGLRRERLVDVRGGIEAISGDSTHI